MSELHFAPTMYDARPQSNHFHFEGCGAPTSTVPKKVRPPVGMGTWSTIQNTAEARDQPNDNYKIL